MNLVVPRHYCLMLLDRLLISGGVYTYLQQNLVSMRRSGSLYLSATGFGKLASNWASAAAVSWGQVRGSGCVAPNRRRLRFVLQVHARWTRSRVVSLWQNECVKTEHTENRITGDRD